MPRNIEANRLTDHDRDAIRARIAETLQLWRDGATAAYVPTIGADFNALQRVAYHSIGCTGYDLRQSECDEIADMVAAAILDAGALAVAR